MMQYFSIIRFFLEKHLLFRLSVDILHVNDAVGTLPGGRYMEAWITRWLLDAKSDWWMHVASTTIPPDP